MNALLEDPETNDYLRKPVMHHEVLAWAWAEAQVSLMRAWLDSEGISAAMTEITTTEETEADSGGGTIRRITASRKVSSLDVRNAQSRSPGREQRPKQLGLTPLSRARLGKDIASSHVRPGQILRRNRRRREKAARRTGRPADQRKHPTLQPARSCVTHGQKDQRAAVR